MCVFISLVLNARKWTRLARNVNLYRTFPLPQLSFSNLKLHNDSITRNSLQSKNRSNC